MLSFTISLLLLILGYLIYGKFVSRIFGPDPSRPTPAVANRDGVDFIPMPTWKVYMIQFLNIAGTGPIFGAIMGAQFGPSAYLWIVFGCIFAGAVHDYLSGMLSVRNQGAGLPQMVGKYLGKTTMNISLVFTVVLLILVGAVFVYSPAIILKDIAGNGTNTAALLWCLVIFAYYIFATMLPIDKIIGKIYPLFAFALIFMAVALMVCLFAKWPDIPEVWGGLANRRAGLGLSHQPIFPCLFITIACGAISGFHATQSPLMARCIKNEKLGRPVFYGAMITEGIVALVWASVSSYFFFDGGYAEVGGALNTPAPRVVTLVSEGWLGIVGGILAILGVVAAPITSGDTALRSARLIIAEALHFPQKKISARLAISIPLFAATALMLWYNIADEEGFNKIWGYFGWANQTLAVFTLWTVTSFLSRRKGSLAYMITLIPAAFMTSVVTSYILIKVGIHLSNPAIAVIASAAAALSLVWFFTWKSGYDRKNKLPMENN